MIATRNPGLSQGQLEKLQLWIYGIGERKGGAESGYMLSSTTYQQSKKWISLLQELITALKAAQETK